MNTRNLLGVSTSSFSFFAIALTVFTGCAKPFEAIPSGSNDKSSLGPRPTPSQPPPQPSATPIPSPTPTAFILPKIQWEKRADARPWSIHAFKTILNKGPSLLDGSDDVAEFCPRYFELDQSHRAWFWTAFISSIAFFESGWDPTDRYQESTMGTDPVTGKPVYSEGLLQLSYQDRQGHPYCNEFDWAADRHLSAKDPRKTILNPEKNLSCGIQILNRQIRAHRRIGIAKGAYWSVIKTSKPSNKIPKIKARIKDSVAACFKG